MSTSGGTLGLLNTVLVEQLLGERGIALKTVHNAHRHCTDGGSVPVRVLCGLVLGVLLQVLQHGGGEALRCSVSETLSKMSTMISSVITKQNIRT